MTENHFPRRKRRGMTLLELLVVMAIIGIIATIIAPAFSSFFNRAQIDTTVRRVTLTLSKARYQSIYHNRRIKVEYDPGQHHIALKKMVNKRWTTYRTYPLIDGIKVSFNRSPVFNPEGTAAPLCSIFISNNQYSYKISISMAGKISKFSL